LNEVSFNSKAEISFTSSEAVTVPNTASSFSIFEFNAIRSFFRASSSDFLSVGFHPHEARKITVEINSILFILVLFDFFMFRP
jgi:hypothetical protein